MQQDDSVGWTLTANGTFSVQSVWDSLRVSGPKVDWQKVVWFKHYVPRWFVIQWMIVLGRLSTRDNLLQWGITYDSSCCLCPHAL